MPNQPKKLTKEDIEQIRSSEDGVNKLAKSFGVQNRRIDVIRKAISTEEALQFAKGMPKKEEPQKGEVSKQNTPEARPPGVARDSFTPDGTATDKDAPKFITIGTFRMPLEDWGYSSTINLLIVAETYEQAKREYNFDDKMKVGDFVAHLCQAFRIMRGWDAIGAGHPEIKGEENAGQKPNDTGPENG